MGSRRIQKDEMPQDPQGMKESTLKNVIQGSPTMRMLRQLELEDQPRAKQPPKSPPQGGKK